ncbi:MAG TPA: NADH-quinone oxidoreductase subunit C [Burkholderiales bacterium]|jgi:NADH-quinone oxidoreductase subunit C
MTPKLQRLHDAIDNALRVKPVERLGELTLEVQAKNARSTAIQLRDHPDLRFEVLIDLCGMDYQTYGPDAGDRPREGGRFAAVVHLLSIKHNWRLRLRAICADDDFPVVPTLTEVWPAASWFEREAFDLFGIIFDGHPDLRRILTDYGFAGHPFRKDFPVSGYVEMRYDPEQKRVIYQPVSIEPREVTPRIVREEHYAEGRG